MMIRSPPWKLKSKDGTRGWSSHCRVLMEGLGPSWQPAGSSAIFSKFAWPLPLPMAFGQRLILAPSLSRSSGLDTQPASKQ